MITEQEKQKLAKEDAEANYFAMCLLMPEHLVRQEFEKVKFDLFEDTWLKDLSKKFAVSTTMMTIRLTQLGILI